MTAETNRQTVAELEAAAKLIQKYESILAHMDDMAQIGWWEFDVLGQKVIWTKAVFVMHGLDPTQNEPTYEEMLQLIHPDDLEHFTTVVGRAFQFGEPYKINYRVIAPNGLLHYLSVQCEVKTNEQGQTIWLLGIAMDMTEHRRGQEELIKAQTLLKSVIEQSPAAIAVASAEGILEIFNDACRKQLGITPESGIEPGTSLFKMNQPWQDFNPDGTPVTVEELPLALALQGQVTRGRELKVVRADGTEVWEIVDGFPIYDETGKLTAGVIIFPDTTERKQAEVERERLQQELLESQQRAIRELSTPIIPIMKGIIILPLIGSIDSERAREITRSLLTGISQNRAKIVIVDITGVSVVDSGVASHLDKTIQAARLKGAQTIITGISDAVAETIVDLGINWSGLETVNNLQAGLAVAMRKLGKE
jgi:rsbT co-antagonist protein RsbR